MVTIQATVLVVTMCCFMVKATEVPESPEAPRAPDVPIAPEVPIAPKVPTVPEAPIAQEVPIKPVVGDQHAHQAGEIGFAENPTEEDRKLRALVRAEWGDIWDTETMKWLTKYVKAGNRAVARGTEDTT